MPQPAIVATSSSRDDGPPSPRVAEHDALGVVANLDTASGHTCQPTQFLARAFHLAFAWATGTEQEGAEHQTLVTIW